MPSKINADRVISVWNGIKPARLLLLQGKPINEPVERYGPFVMNNMGEIRQVFRIFKKPGLTVGHGKGLIWYTETGKEVLPVLTMVLKY